MIKVTKRNGNTIYRKEYKNQNDFEMGKCCTWGFEKINDIDFSKSYIEELYCKKFCRKCYHFGCDWDIRCNKNNKPINQVVSDCEIFQNAKKLYSEIIERMLNDDDFYNFCKFYNTKQKNFEIFLAIFNENRFSENRNEIKFKNR